MRDTIPDVAKRVRPIPVAVYLTEAEKAEIDQAVAASGLSRQDWALATLLARAGGGMSLAPELARHVRAEAKRLKVPAEHVLSSWVLSHVRKEGD